MGLFSGVEKAKPTVGGNFLRAGSYFVRINKVKKGESRKNETFVAIEMTILKVHATAEGTKPHFEGEEATYMLMAKHDSFLNNWKAIVSGVTGCSQDEVTEELSDNIVSEEQPFSGAECEMQAVTVPTKSGGFFTKTAWEQSPAFQD